ncbi:MAG: hypothetical protein ACFFDH_07215 [Promethearchaeota archaeon]
MGSRKNKVGDPRPINIVLLAISFIIFGVLGLVFITQMDLQPGWAWEELRDKYPARISIFSTEDLNDDGINEIIAYSDIQGTNEPERFSDTNIQYGGVYCLEGSTGKLIWRKDYDGPIKQVFPIMDVNGDGTKDYFISKVAIGPDLKCDNYSNCKPEIIPYMNMNPIISGFNGQNIPILTGDGISFTNLYVHDLINLEGLSDVQEDLILLEGEEYYTSFEENPLAYNFSISAYFINGTKTYSINNTYRGSVFNPSEVPKLELFDYIDQSHMLFISHDSMFLYNLSSKSFLNEIYNISFSPEISEYEIIEDLTGDYISEIITISWEGNVTLINGYDGSILMEFNIPSEASDIFIEEIYNPKEDGITYFLLKVRYHESEIYQEQIMRVYRITPTTEEVIWEVIKAGNEIEDKVYVLHDDLNGDLIDEIIYNEIIAPIGSFNEVSRYKILDFFSGNVFAILNTEFFSESIITINDINNDGIKDFTASGDDRIVTVSTSKPIGLWLSPAFPLGLPLFIILVVLLILGIVIIILRGKRLSFQRTKVKEHKLTVSVNILAILLMSFTFLMFLLLLNIFNNTLIPGAYNTEIVIAFLLVTIIWYGTLPITAALYNKFAVQFAYIFIKLRDLFFKISKGYKHDIIVLDLGDKKDIGLVIQLKRLILPLLLSISVGFYAYDVLTTLFEYPTEFDVFGSAEFFGFMMGYMLCCVLPMILSFVVFSFFISGNYLLDDAGIVYYREHKKYRQPGDIEPISIWAQSIVKGIAGLSALITFGTFILRVDFSGYFESNEPFMMVFGFLIAIVMFAGIPFLTAFSNGLLAGEIMELNVEQNIQKLYNVMEKKGYNTKPRDITNIYPIGSESSNKSPSKNKDNLDDEISV